MLTIRSFIEKAREAINRRRFDQALRKLVGTTPIIPGNEKFTVLSMFVTNYLWRPLLTQVAESLAEPGVLIYETFATGNASVGKPSNPDFLLRPGELLQFAAAHGLRVVAYEDGFERDPDRYIQRIVAMRPGTDDTELHRHPLRCD